MKKIPVLIYFTLALSQSYSQESAVKRIQLPEKIRSIELLPTEKIVLSPDGSLLCFMNETAPYKAYLINTSTGIIDDSISISGYGPQIKWSGDSKTIIFYIESYSGSKFELYSRKGDLKGIIATAFPVLNFETDSTANEIAAILYDLPETGATYSSDITGAYIFPKGIKYNYKFCLFDVASYQLRDNFQISTTYPRIMAKWKGKWTLLMYQSDAEYQSLTYAATVDLSTKKIIPIGNSKDLFVNESFMYLQLLPADQLYIKTRNEIYKLDETSDKFKSILRTDEIESISVSKNSASESTIIAGIKGKRWAENKIAIINPKLEKQSIDVRDKIPHIVFQNHDTIVMLSFSKSEAGLNKFLSPEIEKNSKPEILVQNSIEPDSRLTIPNTSFLLEFNNKAWQVTDLSSQLIVHQQKDYANYGTKFTTAGNHPFIIKYDQEKAVLISVGKWNEIAGILQLQHPLLKDGNSLYSQTVSLNSLAYNANTSLLTGIFYSNDHYYATAWDLHSSLSPMYVIRLERKKIPDDKSSAYSKGAAPLLLAETVYQMKEQDWKSSGAADLLGRLKKFTAVIPSFLLNELHSINDYSWQYSIEQGKAIGNFTYQDSIYGHFVIDLFKPSRSVYFCHKPLKGGFATMKYVPYKKEGYGLKQPGLSDKGNFITIANLGHVAVYDLNSNQYLKLVQENKEQGFDGKPHFFIEDKEILVGNNAWYATTGLYPIHNISHTLYIDSVNFFPDKRLFVAHTFGKTGYVSIQLDNLTISQSEKISAPLQRYFIHDTIIRNYFPDKKYLVIAGKNGLGYDSSQKMTPDFMARLFPSSLNGSINYIQMFPEKNKVLIGNTDESAFEYWDVLTEQWIFKLVIADASNFILQSNSGYYYATPNALSQIGFLQKGEAIPASFLDAGLNRPDIVLGDVFDTTERTTSELVQLYRMAAQLKNRKNARFVPGKSPVISMTANSNAILKEKNVTVKVKVTGSENPVNYFSIQANNVLIWDTVFLKPVLSAEIDKSIQLVSGENQLVFQAKDIRNYVSAPLFQRVVYQPAQKQQFSTYIIALAVNNYKDDSRNLKYAVKDGMDLLTAFRSVEGTTVITDSLFDTSFTIANIEKLKEKLMQTSIEDKVIFSFSGHGMLDDSLNFYLATYDMDFENPRKNGLAFSHLEELLTAIPARKKLLLIDACNSGNIDKEANKFVEIEENLTDKVSIQSDTIKSARGVELPVPPNTNLQQVINQLFVSSSSKGGIEVIAATAGNAFAYEAPEWNNGVFTYALLQTFHQNSDLDKNFDGQISIKEIKQFVYPKVTELTNGLQKPLSRYENPNYDWSLFPMRYD